MDQQIKPHQTPYGFTLHDMLTIGAVSGLLAGIVKDGLDLILFYLIHFSKGLYLDFASVLIFGNKPHTGWEWFFAQMAEISWSASVGVLSICILGGAVRKNTLFKSWFYSVVAWFTFYTIPSLYKIQSIAIVPLATAFSQFVTTSIYGVILGFSIQWFDNRIQVNDGRIGGETMGGFIDDRFTRGVLAGWIAGVILTGWNLFSFYILHFTKSLLLDFAAIMIYGRKPHGLWEKIFGEFSVFILCGCFGLLFAYLIKWVSSKNLFFKGWFFSVFLWFMTYAVAKLYKVPTMMKVPSSTATSTLIGVSLFGLALAYSLHRLEFRGKL